MSELLRVYLDPAEVGLDGYPYAWHKPLNDVTFSIKDHIRERDSHRCLRCGHPYIKKQYGNGKWSPCDKHCMHHGPFSLIEPDVYEQSVPGPLVPVVVQTTPELDREYMLAKAKEIGGKHPWILLAEWRILTVHHLNGIKYDCRWWNLVSLCQRCHLTIQGKVFMDRPWTKPHSEWFQPFVAGFYAWKYLDLELTQEETLARLDEMLDLELTQEALF